MVDRVDVAGLIDGEARGSFDDHLNLLVSVTHELATSLDIDETLRTVARGMLEFLSAEASSIFLLEQGSGDLVCRACAGPIDITGLRLSAAQGIVGRTVRDSHCHIVRDVLQDPDFAADVDDSTGFVTRSILSAPLRVGGTCLGALELINKLGGDGLFDERDRRALMVLAASAALAIRNARMATALVEQERIRRELELAREIQRSLLPGPMGPDFPVAGLNVPAREVSGDFYDYFLLGDGRVAFNIADVSGKGVDAALLMARTSSLLRCLGKTLESPSELLARVNDEICETASRGKFVTVVAGVYDPASHGLVVANAGHQPPLLRGGDGHYRELPAQSPPLGILSGMSFPEQRLRLDGGALYLFTDGATEARGDNGRQLGVAGLRRYIERRVAEPLQRRLQSLVEDIGGSHDDITLVLVEPRG